MLRGRSLDPAAPRNNPYKPLIINVLTADARAVLPYKT